MADATLVVAWISWALTLITNVRYNFGRRSPWDSGHQDDVAFTPFTAAFLGVWVFWIIMELSQVGYLLNYFHSSSQQLQTHFIVGNVLLLTWSYLFARGHYFFSEIIIIIAFLNYAIGYLLTHSYRQRSLKSFLTVHMGVLAWPLAWTDYVIMWNGAVLFHARDLPARILGNILIWELLVIPTFFLVVFGDYASGAAFAWISFSLGLGQLATKVFALQWIFAFVIAGILTLFTFVYSLSPPSGAERVPLLNEGVTEEEVVA